MIIIDKDPNKGLLFEPNTGSSLGHPVGFFFLLSRNLTTGNSSNHTMAGLHIQSHDGSITVGFSFLTTTTLKDLVYGQSSSH